MYKFFYLLTEARRKHLIFTLHDINVDQKDALLQMRLPSQTRALFESISVLKALKILSDIQKTSSGKNYGAVNVVLQILLVYYTYLWKLQYPKHYSDD